MNELARRFKGSEREYRLPTVRVGVSPLRADVIDADGNTILVVYDVCAARLKFACDDFLSQLDSLFDRGPGRVRRAA